MSAGNYFAALGASDSEEEVTVKRPSSQKKSDVKKPVRFHKPKMGDGKGDGKAVGLKFQPRVKEPSKSAVKHGVKHVTRPRFKLSSREQVWNQLVDSAVSLSTGKKLSQKQRKRLAREQKREETKETETPWKVVA
jgi:hypothetical protein